LNVLDAMRDPTLFGREFSAESWAAWRTFLAALFGHPLEGEALELYQRCTGRQAPPAAPAREGWVIAGRRGGKSRIAALVAVFLAAFRSYSGVLAPGERGTVVVIAADRRQARTIFRYALGLLQSVPMLARLVEQHTREEIRLAGRVSIEVHTCSFRAVRGYTIVGAVLDEVAFWRVEDAADPDHEVANALRPGMATVPGSLLLGISSPYARRGVLWSAYREHFGKDASDALVWKAPSRTMNPLLPERIVRQALEEDPAAASAEYQAEFRSDVEGFLAREVVEAGVVPGRRELPPVDGVRYLGFCDPSGGSADSMTLAIAHREDGDPPRAVLDLVRERRPPFSPDAVVRDFAADLKRYRLSSVTGDRYSAGWVVERFQAHGIRYTPAPKAKSDLYTETLPLLNAGRAELLDHPRLVAQLSALERRTSRGGRDSIDHPAGGHDDLANSAAGGLFLAVQPRTPLIVSGGAPPPSAEDVAALVRAGGGAWMPEEPL